VPSPALAAVGRGGLGGQGTNKPLVRLRRRRASSGGADSGERSLDALIERESELFKSSQASISALDSQATGVTAAGLIVAPLLARGLWGFLDPISLVPGAIEAAFVAGVLDLLAVALGAASRLLGGQLTSDPAVKDADRNLERVRQDDALAIKRAVLSSWNSRRAAGDRRMERKSRYVRAALVCLLGTATAVAVLLILIFDVAVESLNY
jgi:hypothetical protein